MKIKYFLFFLLLFITFFSSAQSGKFFSVDKELSSSLVNNVYQDRNGLIWIATEDGLNRYDGSKFSIYKQDQDSLLSNFVRYLFEDSNGNFYIGFYNGLQLYDHTTGVFKEIPLYLEKGGKFGAHVFSILERQNGDILVGSSGHGLFFLKFNGDSVYAKQSMGLIPSHLINYLYEDKDQNLWVATQDKGLFRLSKENKLKSFSESGDMRGSNISSITEDKEGNLYVGSQNKGLFVYDHSSDSFSSVPDPDHQNLPVNTLYSCQDGTIYIGTEGEGLKMYDPVSGKISVSNYNVSTLDLSKAKISSIIKDRSGNVWVGIYQKGVLLLPASSNNFHYIGQKSIHHNVIGSNVVSAVHRDHEGTLWVGTDGDGLYGISPDGKQVVHFEPDRHENSVPSTIMSIYEDSNHDLWLGSYKKGMALLNKASGECQYVNNLLDKDGFPAQRIFCFEEDQDMQLWVGSMGSGLYAMDLNTKDFTRYQAMKGTDYRTDANVLHNDWINSLLLSRDQKLYIGTFDGLGCLDLKTKSFVSTYGTNRLLAGQIVYSLYEDKQGTIWIGTSKGLMYISKDSSQIQAYTTENGLPSNVICAIKGDDKNNLWISTNYGISKMNLQTRSFNNFYAEDGLQGNEFSKDAAYVDQNGQIIFGGFNGITYFQPDEIVDEGKKLEVRITDFYIHDRAIKKGMKSGSLDIINTSVREADTFHLSHDDNSFTIEFSAMEFINPEHITYMYSMQDENWIRLRPGTNTVTFNNLTPGEYTFRVKAKDYNTFSDEKKIAVVISPAWYFSVQAKLAYFIMLAAFIYLLVRQVLQRYRTRKKIQEHIQAKQINEAKLQFFINIAHEIRTPMTLIISPLKKLMNHDQNGEHQKAYFTMHRNSERILLLINQLMDIRKIDKGQMQLKFREIEIVAYIRELCSIFDEQSSSRNIELQFRHEMEKLSVWVDPKNFDKVILNILANALKFTPEHGKINVQLCTGTDEHVQNELKHYFEISIADTGIGINENELEHIFECFFQTEASQTNFSGGTGIGLHLSRSIAQLHHGTIKAENNKDGQGCRFIIRLPLGNSHLRKEEIEHSLPVTQESEQFAQPLVLPATETKEKKIKSKSKHRVLVVDDDEEIRKYVCQELATEYHMMDCANGKEALSLVLKDAPDLIISDIMMPEMDGITLCRKIKQHVNINHVPVILLTAKSEEEDNLAGIAVGADAYIVKPFSTDILNKTIKNIIRNRKMLQNNFSGNQQQEDKVQKVEMKSANEKLIEKIMDIISKNIENPAFNVEMLAREVGISRVHLHRKAKELTNQSTRDLIRNTRLQQAGNLLSSKSINISEVAYAVGFTNLATFSNAFKEFYGVPPTTYMENHLKEVEKATENS